MIGRFFWEGTATKPGSCQLLRVVLAGVCFCLAAGNATAQTCPEQSGRLVLNETFGSANQTGPLPTGQTTYRYVSQFCPTDGEYTTRTSLDSSCFGDTWHIIPRDHTPGSVGGNMLLVNGDARPGEFFRQSVTGLCANTSYEVSIWALNLLRANTCFPTIQPNLTMRIESASGAVLREIDLGNLPETTTPVWQRYTTVFSVSQASATVTVRFINNRGEGGCGNDMALDDLQLRQCTACATNPVQIPEAFSPNNDGINDELVIFLDPLISFDLIVYDRWGTAIFASNSPANRWNGMYNGVPCPPGTYTCQITYRLGGTTDPADHPFTQTGQVMLLR